MKKTKLATDCHAKIMESDCTLEGAALNFLAILQALQFTIANKKEYLKKYPCKACYEKVKYTQEYIASMIADLLKHNSSHYIN